MTDAEIDNPDCKPATRGYVKHIARILVESQRKHVFYENSPSYYGGVPSATTALALVIVWLASLNMNNPAMTWSCGIGAAVCFVITIESLMLPKITADVKSPIKKIRKYKPKCKIEEKKP